MSWQDRESAPFGQEIWDAVDATARAAAEEVRAGRLVLEVIGPLGFGARAGIAEDVPIAVDPTRAHLHVPRIRAMPVLHRTVELGARAVEANAQLGEPLVLLEIAEAARQIARAEDRLLFDGVPESGVAGLLAHPGAVARGAGDWSDPGRAADDLLAALAALDAAGWPGPYAAAVSPGRYYQLLRPHPGTSLTPFQQLQPAFAGGIVKASALPDGAVVVLRSPSGPRAVVGQELSAAYDGHEGIFHRISLVESITLLPGEAGSVAVLRGGG
jgi:uncharacterized linocin/CFP29 family protein